MTAPFRITSTSLSSITSYIVQYILTWLHLTHTTLLVFHSRMLGRNLSPGTTKMGGKNEATHFNVHTEVGLRDIGGLLRVARYPDSNCAGTLRLFWMEACTVPVTTPACQRRRYVTISTHQPRTDHEVLFIPVHKVKIHLISWRYKAVYGECSFYQPPNKMGDIIFLESFF